MDAAFQKHLAFASNRLEKRMELFDSDSEGGDDDSEVVGAAGKLIK